MSSYIIGVTRAYGSKADGRYRCIMSSYIGISIDLVLLSLSTKNGIRSQHHRITTRPVLFATYPADLHETSRYCILRKIVGMSKTFKSRSIIFWLSFS